MEPQLFQEFKAMDDPATAAAAAHFWPAQLHREDTAAFEADIADLHLFAREFLAGRGFNDRRASLAAEQKAGGVRFRVTADQEHALAHFGHHVAEVGQREGFADTALTVDRNDLGFFGRFPLGDFQRRLLMRFVAQAGVEIFQIRDVERHAWPLQSRIIFKQAGSVNAVS